MSTNTNTLTLTGMATVYETPYEVGFYTETIAKGAAKRSINNPDFDCQLLVQHAGLPLAAVKSGTLRLSEVEWGLYVEADLDRTDPDVQALEPKLRRGDCTEMSLAFRAVEQTWNDDYSKRRITQMDLNRGDVSVVSYGANASTSVSLRSRELLGERKGQQSRLPLEVRRQRAEAIGRRVAFTGRIATVGGTVVRARRVTANRSRQPIPNHTMRARAAFAALERKD